MSEGPRGSQMRRLVFEASLCKSLNAYRSSHVMPAGARVQVGPGAKPGKKPANP
jgi:hypothetical protein